MIISERGLVKAMKAALKEEGFFVARIENRLIVYSEEWYVEMNIHEAARKVLAFIVECLGGIPAEGETYTLQRGEIPAREMDKFAEDDRREWTNFKLDHTTEWTPMLFDGMLLYQQIPAFQDEFNRIFGIDTVHIGIVDRAWAGRTAEASEDGRLRWRAQGSGELIIIMGKCATNGTSYAEPWKRSVWNVLEHIDLHIRQE